MNSLFSKSSLLILESLSFTKTLYAFDFDGTLSKIVRVPSKAGISQTTEKLLRDLSLLAPVAIISGRSLTDLRSRLSFQPQFLIGNHGLEGLTKHSFSLESAQKTCHTWKTCLVENLPGNGHGNGIELEDKTYSLAIHFRHSRQKKIVKSRIFDAIKTLSPMPRIISGKSVVNLVPFGSPHKGIALLELLQKADAKQAFYIGDDDTDEDVFSLPNPQIMTVRVGQKKISQARYFLDRQSQINRLLKLLIAFHRPTKTK